MCNIRVYKLIYVTLDSHGIMVGHDYYKDQYIICNVILGLTPTLTVFAVLKPGGKKILFPPHPPTYPCLESNLQWKTDF